jgi:hypothetical protein
MYEHPSHGLSRQAACSLTTKTQEEPKITGAETVATGKKIQTTLAP